MKETVTNAENIKLHATEIHINLFAHVLTLNVTYWHDFTIILL